MYIEILNKTYWTYDDAPAPCWWNICRWTLVSHKRLNDEEVHSTLTLQPPLFIAIEIQKYEDAIKISQSSWTAPDSLFRKD